MRNETTTRRGMKMTTIREFSKGSKRATVQKHNDEFVAWVGFADSVEGAIPARFFKGFTTCSNSYRSESAAIKAVEKFFNK